MNTDGDAVKLYLESKKILEGMGFEIEVVQQNIDKRFIIQEKGEANLLKLVASFKSAEALHGFARGMKYEKFRVKEASKEKAMKKRERTRAKNKKKKGRKR